MNKWNKMNKIKILPLFSITPVLTHILSTIRFVIAIEKMPIQQKNVKYIIWS